MPDVTINRCTLRIVRHGGWSWGATPEKLLQSAIKILPELIALELDQFWTEEDDDEEIAAPVRISIPIHLNELLAIGNAGILDREFNYSSEFTVVGQRINSAVRAALIDKCALPEPAAASNRSLQLVAEVEQRQPRLESYVVEVLRSWQRQAVLAQRLAVFSAAALEAWHEYIVRISDSATVVESDEIDAAKVSIAESVRFMPLASATHEANLRRRLIAIAEVMARFELARCPAAVLSKLDEVIPLVTSRADDDVVGLNAEIELNTERSGQSQVEHSEQTGAGQSRQTQAERFQKSHISQSRLAETQYRSGVAGAESESLRRDDASDVKEFSGQPLVTPPVPASIRDAKTPARSRADLALVQPGPTSRENVSTTNHPANPGTSQQSHANPQAVPTRQQVQRIAGRLRREASALPFLALGPLSHTGYLNTLAAVLEASENTEASPLFATALAYKLLAPPERGWRRDAKTLSSAAAFAGLETPAPEPALVQFAQAVSPHLSPLDATLAGALIAGHDRNAPLLLLNEQDGFLLFDTEGVFPIQRAAEITDLRSTLIQLDSSLVFIPGASADVELLRWLTREGLRFVTDAPPTRGETLRNIRRPPDLRWWTNDETVPDSVFARMAASLPASVEDALELMQVLAKDRPSIPLAPDSALDRHLTMAAGVALGTIAWDLWKEREQTAPHVALERFADLHAHVDYADDLVTVTLPLGKRFLDLRDQGLLEDVHDVPWFNGRRLIFTSG